MSFQAFVKVLRSAAVACLLVTPAIGSEVYDTGDPYDGQEITYSPSRVLIRFTEPVRMTSAVLENETGRSFEVRYGMPEDDAGADAVNIRVTSELPPGKYRLFWVAYVLGHRHDDDGMVRFTVLPVPTPAPAAP